MDSKIKTVMLDADMTFLDFPLSEERALDRLFDTYGIPRTLIGSYLECNRQCWAELEEGLIDNNTLKERRFRLFVDKEGLDQDPARLSQDYIDFLASEGHLIEGAWDFLEKLKAHFELVLVTNGIASVQRGRLESTGTIRFFKHLVISEEVGAPKPQTAFFDRALEICGRTKDECIVVGDSLTSDIKGALDSGIKALWLHPGRKDLGKAPDGVMEASSYKEALDILIQ